MIPTVIPAPRGVLDENLASVDSAGELTDRSGVVCGAGVEDPFGGEVVGGGKDNSEPL